MAGGNCRDTVGRGVVSVSRSGVPWIGDRGPGPSRTLFWLDGAAVLQVHAQRAERALLLNKALALARGRSPIAAHRVSVSEVARGEVRGK